MFFIPQLRSEILVPITDRMGMGGPAAVNLLLGTHLVESLSDGRVCVRQLGGGPARGIFQMEPATAKDIVARYAEQRPDIRTRIAAGLHGLVPPDVAWDESWTAAETAALEFRLTTDIGFQVALARLRYFMDPAPLPDPDDIRALAGYWKRVYNTAAGAGNPDKFVRFYREHGQY